MACRQTGIRQKFHRASEDKASLGVGKGFFFCNSSEGSTEKDEEDTTSDIVLQGYLQLFLEKRFAF